MTKEKEKVYVEPDTSYREEIAEQIRVDLESGEIDRLTYAIARSYGLKTDLDIRKTQLELMKAGCLEKVGNRFRRAA